MNSLLFFIIAINFSLINGCANDQKTSKPLSLVKKSYRNPEKLPLSKMVTIKIFTYRTNLHQRLCIEIHNKSNKKIYLPYLYLSSFTLRAVNENKVDMTKEVICQLDQPNVAYAEEIDTICDNVKKAKANPFMGRIHRQSLDSLIRICRAGYSEQFIEQIKKYYNSQNADNDCISQFIKFSIKDILFLESNETYRYSYYIDFSSLKFEKLFITSNYDGFANYWIEEPCYQSLLKLKYPKFIRGYELHKASIISNTIKLIKP